MSGHILGGSAARQAVERVANGPRPGGSASRVTVTLVAIAATLAFALSGCSGDRPAPGPAAAPAQPAAAARAEEGLSPVRPEKTTEPPHAAPSPHRTKAPGAGSGDAGLDRFVAAVQQQLPEVALDRRDEEIEALGQQACEDPAAGKKALTGEGLTDEQAGKLAALARATLCRP